MPTRVSKSRSARKLVGFGAESDDSSTDRLLFPAIAWQPEFRPKFFLSSLDSRARPLRWILMPTHAGRGCRESRSNAFGRKGVKVKK